MSPRLACLRVPLFPLAARLRVEPELAGEAAAVFAGNGTSARLVAATKRARKAGLTAGMTSAQARALVPDLLVRGRDPICEESARQALLEVAERHSPRVEDAGGGEVYLDLDGLELHWRGEDPEVELGHALLAAAAAAGLPARAGIAESKLAARVAAEQPRSPTIVATGEAAAFLAPLPLHRLAAAGEVTDTLRRWGLRSIGDFARLDRHEVASRLGEAGQELHRLSRGLDGRPLVPHCPPPVFCEGLELDWPLERLEPFLFMARTALERLVRRLEGCGLACRRLEVELRLEPTGTHARGLDLPSPTRDPRTLLTLVRLDLEGAPPGAPVTGFVLTAHPDRPREAQLTLFGPEALAPDRLATTLARLFTVLGPERAGAPEAVDSHRPEGFRLAPYAPPPPPQVAAQTRPGRGLLAVRTLRPPLPLEVLGDDRPRSLRTTVGEETAKRPRIDGRVRVASGPWRLESDWWEETPARRDYWDVELAGGGLYRIFRDRASGEWFADGMYD
ncbi:MAG: DNA polymerase Y family protein [Thermoanaerobaculia bacterium]